MQRWSKAAVLGAVLGGCIILLPFLRPSRPARGVALVRVAASEGDPNIAVDGPSSESRAGQASTRPSTPASLHSERDQVPNVRAALQESVHTESEPFSDVREPGHLSAAYEVKPGSITSNGVEGEQNERQKAVVEMFKHAWGGYKQFAWGKDELRPITKTSTSSYGLGLTLVDSLDTMWLMGLSEEFQEAREWVAHSLNIVDSRREVSVFEANIRVLGGLLAAYHLSKDHIFLQKAVELGDRLLPAFKTTTGIPYGSVVLNKEGSPRRGSRVACVAELGSLQLEFRDLSHSTRDSKYQAAADRALDVFQSNLGSEIAPQEVDIETGDLRHTELTVGARTDSYYEYLVKQWIQSGKKEEKIRKWYEHSANQIMTKFIKFSRPNHMAFPAILENSDGTDFRATMDHLACFLPGMLALGYLHGFPQTHLQMARNLTNTCYQFYHQSPSGLSPEEVMFFTHTHSQTDFHPMTPVNLLRPETVESLFVLYRVTRDPIYREWGWEILQAFQRHGRVQSGGFASLRHTNTPYPSKTDKMESFFLAETLKYLFLLFSDEDVLPLDKWVFNTEAHPLPIWTS